MYCSREGQAEAFALSSDNVFKYVPATVFDYVLNVRTKDFITMLKANKNVKTMKYNISTLCKLFAPGLFIVAPATTSHGNYY